MARQSASIVPRSAAKSCRGNVAPALGKSASRHRPVSPTKARRLQSPLLGRAAGRGDRARRTFRAKRAEASLAAAVGDARNRRFSIGDSRRRRQFALARRAAVLLEETRV
ncbi:hypothetical protein A1351_17540 [Methylosinus sp. R-45379]|nr:hypothetical protein A1351_17540 [Methylosinus sp. R-45379]